ncbi:MAG: MFS transporter [Desulfobacterales bacterium]|nr:MFS transporter [Desulfobacterales bacterium]
MTDLKPDSIWTRTFVLICLSQFFGYAQQSLLSPTFPLYVTQLNGTPFVIGMVIASFAVTSVIFRPLIGFWADRWNEAGVLVVGLLLLSAGVLLCLIPSIGASMLANSLRGIGWAGLNTGGYSLLALSAPLERRGEAAGYYTGIQSSVTIFFPAIALWILQASWGGYRTVFLVAVALAAMGAAAGRLLARCVPVRTYGTQTFVPGAWWKEFFNLMEREVRLPAALLFCLQFSLPAVTSFIVLYAREIGIVNIGPYFVVNGLVSIFARSLLGRLSDNIGRGRSILAGFALQSLAFILLAAVSNLAGILISGVLYMLGSAIAHSAILALAMERANPQRRGRALASFSLAFPLSNGVGALLTGSSLELVGYAWTFLFLAGCAALGLALTLACRTGLQR